MLADDAVLYADGGGRATTARRPIVGGARIARVLSRIARKRRRGGPFALELVWVNGQPGRILRGPDGQISDVLSIDVAGGRIRAVRIVRNPEKLAHL